MSFRAGDVTVMNILLVEDNPGDVRLMKEALTSSGTRSRLSVVEDGDQALRYLHRDSPYSEAVRPDIIFLDLNLPKRDGREVLAQVKTHTDLRRIPVIVLTTSEASLDVQKAYDLYANCYVRKPNDLDEYLSVVKACENFWLSIVRLPE